MIRILVRLLVDEGGQDLIEYGLLGGLIGSVGVLVLPGIASRMSDAYAATISALTQPSIVEPCAPGGSCP